MLTVIEWFRGPVSNSKSVARLVTKGDDLEKSVLAGAKVWIDSMDCDLIIQNLTLDDAGLYTCSLAGLEAQTVQLNIITGMFEKAV